MAAQQIRQPRWGEFSFRCFFYLESMEHALVELSCVDFHGHVVVQLSELLHHSCGAGLANVFLGEEELRPTQRREEETPPVRPSPAAWLVLRRTGSHSSHLRG